MGISIRTTRPLGLRLFVERCSGQRDNQWCSAQDGHQGMQEWLALRSRRGDRQAVLGVLLAFNKVRSEWFQRKVHLPDGPDQQGPHEFTMAQLSRHYREAAVRRDGDGKHRVRHFV